MNTTLPDTWYEANQRYLMAALAVVRAALERHAARSQDAPEPEERNRPRRLRWDSPTRTDELELVGEDGPTQALQEAADAMPVPPALGTLGQTFGLSPFECDLLLLCAGMELDSTFAAHCAAAQGNSQRTYPTFGLALAILPEAHWSALTPGAPLRYWRLVEVEPGETLTTSPLRIDERVLHYLAGVHYLDERLHGLIEPLNTPGELPPSHHALVHKIAGFWSRAEGTLAEPIIQLCGDEDGGKHAVAAAASAVLGLQLHAIRAADIPAAAVEREALVRLWEREAALGGSALLVDCQDLDGADGMRPALSLLECVRSVPVVTARDPLRTRKRPLIHLDVNKPSAVEQQNLWQEALGPLAQELNGQIETLTTQFNLGVQGIHAVS